jgi:flagellar motor component MotA
MGLFQDRMGNLSSKRVAGYILMGVALVGGFVGAVLGNGMLVDYAKWLVVTGAGAVIAGVAERGN